MYDILIQNGIVVDGSGSEPFHADVAIEDGKIARVERGISECAAQVIDARGQYVTPGFIDIHRHGDAFVFRPGFGERQVRQGITTAISGNCGLSIAPCPTKWRREILQYLKPAIGSLPEGVAFETFSEYLRCVEQLSLPFNYGMHIGNGTLRMAAKGFEKGELNDDEYAVVHRYLCDAIESGAFGVSIGLVYMPENMYDKEGIIRALEPIRDSSIPIVAHIRGEGDLLVSSLEEAIGIARELNVPLHVSHYKCVGPRNWGHLLKEATDLLDRSRAEDMRVTCDVYPWTAGSTLLAQLLPPEFLEGGMDKAVERLRDPALRRRCREILERPQTYFENLLYLVGWENIMVTSVQTDKNQQYVGKRMTEIAQIQGRDPYECAFDLLIDENFDVSMVNFIVCEQDIEAILKYPYSYVISDSIYPDGGLPHPRQHGTFPKLLAEYVREKKVLTLPQAIHKMTGAPAEGMRIAGKGFVKEGYDADLAVFDLERITNNADYIHPERLATGFSYVLVNGRISNDHDRFINTGAGKVLRRGDN